MHIRPYHPTDLSSIGDVLNAANLRDTLVHYFNRNIDKYPFTFRKGGVQFLRGLVLGHGTYAFVMETDTWDQPTKPSSNPPTPLAPFVAGFVIYTRRGTSPTALSWQQSNSTLSAALDRKIINIERKYRTYLPSIDPVFNSPKFNSIFHILEEPWPSPVLDESWEINALFVHPDYQRQGLASRLLAWGKERCTEEKIPLLVAGSPVGGLAYKHAGFRSIGVSGFGEYFDELAEGGMKMQRWVWEPETLEKNVVEEARKVAKQYKKKWMKEKLGKELSEDEVEEKAKELVDVGVKE